MALIQNIQNVKSAADMAYDFLPGAMFDFVIRAQGGSGGGSGGNWMNRLGEALDAFGSAQTLTLKGAASPIATMDYGGETKYKKTNYPGNDVASAQIITTNNTPLRIHGILKDNELNGATATYYREQIEIFKKSKRALSIEWGQVAKDAIIEDANFQLHAHDEIEYDITFEIMADAGDGAFELDYKKPLRSAMSLIGKVGNSFAGVTSVFNSLPLGLDSKVLGKISSPMNRATGTANRVFKL